MSKNLRNGNRETETRRKTRKAFPYNRKILELYQKSKCRECTVQVSAVEINAVLEKTKPLSDKEVAQILEGHASDTSVLSNTPLSPRAESRLRKKENGMVLLPRSFYNEHPARKVLDSKKSKSKSTTKDKKDYKSSHKYGNSSKSKDNSKSLGSRNNSSTIQKENEPLGRGLRQKIPKGNKLKIGKPSFNSPNSKSKVSRPRKVNGLKPTRSHETEYQLVFVDPINSNGRKLIDPTLLSLADLLNTDKLPSKIWEVERVPPLLVNTKSDVTYNAIAAELDALMADTERPNPMEIINANPTENENTNPVENDNTELVEKVNSDLVECMNTDHVESVNTNSVEKVNADPVESMDTDPDQTDEKLPRDLNEEVPPTSNDDDEIPKTNVVKSNGDDEDNSKEDITTTAEINTDKAMEVDSLVDDFIEKTVSKDPKDSTKESSMENEQESTKEESSMGNEQESTKKESPKENEKVEAKVESFMEKVDAKDEKMDIDEDIKEDAKEVEIDLANKESTDDKINETIDNKNIIQEKEDELVDSTPKIIVADTENIKLDEKKANENEIVKDDEGESILEESQITKEQEKSATDSESKNSIEATNLEDEPIKVPEEFPSIMDLLNDTPTSISDDSKEAKEEPSDKTEISQEKPDASTSKLLNLETPSSNTEEECLKDILNEPITRQAVKPAGKNITEDKHSTDEVKVSGNEDDEITSVVFRRFSSDKQTYDRLVIFQSDLEYTVKINNKEVELLGAPKYMTSTEDLQILLQIVDEVNLDSFNVICKS